MEAGEAKRRGLRALATFVAGASAGVDPSYMGIGPVPATRKALAIGAFALGTFGLGFTLGGLIFGRSRKA
jgi:acetyl-CoA C-acetyltransferase